MGRPFFHSICIAGILFLLSQGGPLHAEVTCGAIINEELTLTKNLIVRDPDRLNCGRSWRAT